MTTYEHLDAETTQQLNDWALGVKTLHAGAALIGASLGLMAGAACASAITGTIVCLLIAVIAYAIAAFINGLLAVFKPHLAATLGAALRRFWSWVKGLFARN